MSPKWGSKRGVDGDYRARIGNIKGSKAKYGERATTKEDWNKRLDFGKHKRIKLHNEKKRREHRGQKIVDILSGVYDEELIKEIEEILGEKDE